MFIILPIIAFIFLFLIFNYNDSWRSSVLSASLVWGVLITAITEGVSLFRLIEFGIIQFIWFAINIILFAIAFHKKNSKVRNSNKLDQPEKIPLFLFILLFGIVFVAGTVSLIALIAPTNNWDSMAYHMPRVVHWIQNHSVEHYPTNYLAQLYQSPWTEFVIMHFQILSGGDRFANLVQWFSMVGSIIAVSLIAKELGANLFGQILSSVVAVTIPMGILQASSTKNDYAVCFWLVCLAYYILKTLKTNIDILSCLKVGTSLGLAIFTKGTAYVYALPFLLWFITGIIQQWRWKLWKPILLLTCVAISINLGHYLRNLDLFGTPIYSPPEYKIESITFLLFISNVIRNMALHMAIPLDIVNNNVIEEWIQKLHLILGVDINDTRITSEGIEFGIPGIPSFEDTAGNPLHFYLILTAVVIFINNKKLRKDQYLWKYLLTVISAFFLFCLMIKWQPWQSRLHISLFVLFAPFVGIVFSKLVNKKIGVYLAIILLQVSLFWVFYNESRPIIGDNNIFNTSRLDQYFANKRYLKEDYIDAVKLVKSQGCSKIGLSMPRDAWEYPLWVLLQQNNNQPIRIEHINVTNVSSIKVKQYPYKGYSPCAIIDVEFQGGKKIVFQNSIYVKKWSGVNFAESVIVYIKQSSIEKKENKKS